MHRVLTAVGAIRSEHIGAAAESLYAEGVYDTLDVNLTLCCVGGKMSREIFKQFPKVPQLIWPDIAAFIYRRFQRYFGQKLSHPQWDETGQALWKLFEDSQSVKEFSATLEARLTGG